MALGRFSPRHRTVQRRPDLLILATWIALADLILQEVRATSQLLVIGSYHLWLIDVAVACLVLAILFPPPSEHVQANRNYSRLPGTRVAIFSVIILISLTAIELARGAYLDWFKAAISERVNVFALLFGISILSVPGKHRKIELFVPMFVVGILCISAIFLIRIQFGPTFLMDPNFIYEGEYKYGENRSILHDSAMMICLCGTVLLYYGLTTKTSKHARYYFALGMIAAIIVIASRQRTVSIATLVGGMIMLSAEPRILSKVSPVVRAMMFAISLTFLSFVIVVGPETLFSSAPESFRSSVTKTGTLDARHKIWQAALERFAEWDVIDKFIGREAGRPYNLIVNDRAWIDDVHDTYIAFLMRHGYVGISALIAIIIGAMFQSLRAVYSRLGVNSFGFSGTISVTILAELLVFGYSYEWRNFLTIFLFFCSGMWPALEAKRRIRVGTPRPQILANHQRPTPRRRRDLSSG
jgi:hypothetical protein